MNCRNVQPLLNAYLDGELSTADTDQLRRHLDVCVACQRQLARHRSVSESFRRLDPQAAPESFAAAIRACLPARANVDHAESAEFSRSTQAIGKQGSRYSRWPLIAAVILMAIGWGWWRTADNGHRVEQAPEWIGLDVGRAELLDPGAPLVDGTNVEMVVLRLAEETPCSTPAYCGAEEMRTWQLAPELVGLEVHMPATP